MDTLGAVHKLGWAMVSVLKQERYAIYQEASALSWEQKPRALAGPNRRVQLREVPALDFGAAGAGRVVLADEQWTERSRRAGQTLRTVRQSHWRWVVQGLDGYGPEVIWSIGHWRWGVENHTFNELTPYYHLTHCPRHELVALVAWLLIRVLGFNLFELLVRLHGKV
jgi:hypothetical protein